MRRPWLIGGVLGGAVALLLVAREREDDPVVADRVVPGAVVVNRRARGAGRRVA
jgi:hypothetical protein